MPRLAALLALTALLATAARAQAPREIPYQGTLADGGAPVTSATPVVFRLHDAATGGEVVWAESQTVAPDADGRFTARLGSATDLPEMDRPLWLSVTADGTLLGPRTPLGAAPYALALPGFRTTASGEPLVTTPNVIVGASNNSVAAGVGGATISGGGGVGEGEVLGNQVGGLLGTIGGGSRNDVSAPFGTIGGGDSNEASGMGSTVGGGIGHRATGASSTIAGGSGNNALGERSTIGGGQSHSATGDYSTVPGGRQNSAVGTGSFAAGTFARAEHDGAFVWADASLPPPESFVSTAPHQFLIRAAGGVGIGTAMPGGQLHVETEDRRAGVFLNDGSVGLNTATVFAENSSTANGTVGWFEGNGTGQIVVANQNGSGDLYRGIQSGNLRFRVQANGNVTADGTFTGGGADLAEFFPLADGAAASPGQVVGLRGGRVSLSTDGAEQVAVISSNPAFIGNPNAAEGGALVALVGQVTVQVSGNAAAGDLLIASGDADGRARAVSPNDYTPTDGAVLGRVLTSGAGGVVALVGVDEAAALRGVVAQLLDDRNAQREVSARQAAELDALRAEVQAIRDALAPRAARR